MTNAVQVNREGRVLTITLQKPPLNILEHAHIEMLAETLTSVEDDRSIDVIWLRAENTKAFCAGVSIADHLPDRAPAMLASFRQLSVTMQRLRQVIVIEVFGAVLGGGMELMVLSDLVVASDDARFGQPEILLAATPPVAAALLPARIGWQEAARLCLLGETQDVAWAVQRGLVTRVVPRTQLKAVAQTVVDQVLKLSGPALRATKRIMAGRGAGAVTAINNGFDIYFSDLLPTKDSQEGIEAFLAKRSPVWQHR